jgi:acyl-CoA dehydrogenase
MKMELVVTEEQRMLEQAARDFVAGRSSLKRARAGAMSHELWKEMAALGWLGLLIPEELGGSALGYRYAMVVMEQLGRGLMPEPMLSTVMLGANAIATGGSKPQREAMLPAVARGETLLALAYQELQSRWSLTAIETTAEKAGAEFVLHGEKTHVLGGANADTFVVSAQHGAGVGLFVVPAKAKGVHVEPLRRIDARDAATVKLEGVRVDADATVGAPDGALWILERIVDAGTIALCAEMLGSMQAALSMTLEYLKTRVQFGVPIGSFQALQHRAARMYAESELARSAVMYAHALLDERAPAKEIARAASVAKAKCSDAFMLVAHEAVQMHGGIGMTDEHDVGLFLKRARVAEMTFGDAAFHRDRFAKLGGY